MAAATTAAGAAGHTVRDLVRTSAVVGAVDVEISRSDVDLLVEACTDSTIFVTASLRSLTLRGLTRCTVIAAPSTATVTIVGCMECVVSGAAPSVVASDVVGSLLFVASRTPVSVGGSSRDVRMGPYNVVGDGLLSNSGMREWALRGGSGGSSGSGSGGGSGSSSGGGGSSSGGGSPSGSSGTSAGSAGDTFCRLDSAAAACVRAITPADFFWRFLPVPQLRGERLPLPAAFATPELPADLARLDTRDTARSQRIEQLTQMKFVVRVQPARLRAPPRPLAAAPLHPRLLLPHAHSLHSLLLHPRRTGCCMTVRQPPLKTSLGENSTKKGLAPFNPPHARASG